MINHGIWAYCTQKFSDKPTWFDDDDDDDDDDDEDDDDDDDGLVM